jgi:CxxC-x17-CxxC domain-containing protein
MILRDILRFGPREMHETSCSECGSLIQVPFTSNSPVRCKACYELEDDLGSVQRAYIGALRTFCERLAEGVADNPNFLDFLEWRQLEQMLAEVFSALGFSVTLGRGTKDKGKDLVLDCEFAGRRQRYYVQIKHWRSDKRINGVLLREFVNVVLRDRVDSGVMLSTSGFTSDAYEALTVLDRKILQIGDRSTVCALCRTFVKSRGGFLIAPASPSYLFRSVCIF